MPLSIRSGAPAFVLALCACTTVGPNFKPPAAPGAPGYAMAGDATLFARQDVVEAAWQVVDPIINRESDLFEYDPGSWGPKEADKLVEAVGGWNTPQ